MGGYCGFDVVQLHCSFQAKLHHSFVLCLSIPVPYYCYNLQYPFSNTNILTFLATYLMLKNRYPPTYFRNMPLLWPNGQGKLSVALTQVWYSTTFVRRSACILDPSNFGRIRYHVLLAALSVVVIPDQGVKPSEALSGWPCCSARGAPPTVASHQRYDTVKFWVIIHYFHTS